MKGRAIGFDGVLLLVCFFGGLVFGGLRPRLLAPEDYAALAAALGNFATDFAVATPAESLLRYIRPLGLIWACAALPMLRRVAFLVVYLRAMTLAFSAAMLHGVFGAVGLVMALALYGAQNVIVLPVYMYTAYFVAAKPVKVKTAGILAAIGVAAAVVAAVIEIYAAPVLFRGL